VNGCDSNFILNLTVNPVYSFVENHIICENDVYVWHGNPYFSTGTYIVSYTTATGCDSMYTLNLTVSPNYYVIDSVKICQGDSVWLNGAYQTMPGMFNDLFISMNGCDSVVMTHLIVNESYSIITDTIICSGSVFTWQGVDYSAAGTYFANYQTVSGCDSNFILNLTVNPVYSFVENHIICENDVYVWHGSVVMTHLIVNESYSIITDTIICSGSVFTWQGVDYTTNSQDTVLYQTMNGCDSIHILNLLIHGETLITLIFPDSLEPTSDSLKLAATPAGGIWWCSKPEALTANGIFIPCLADTTWNIIRYSYLNSFQCLSEAMDSIYVGTITSDFSSKLEIRKVYPNPTTGEVFLKLSEKCHVQVLNAHGQVLTEKRKFLGPRFEIPGAPGIYFLKISKTATGETWMHKIIKTD